MATEPHLLAGAVILATVSAGLFPVLSSLRRFERLLALQLLGTAGVAIVLLLAEGMAMPGLRDLALVLALLAATVAVAFIRYGECRPPARVRRDPDPPQDAPP